MCGAREEMRSVYRAVSRDDGGGGGDRGRKRREECGERLDR